ncbi:hypothetical protein [Labilibacter marinus]|uniref:hypothetical protein n=1 Tax=Labilibacter marinus TaxID=1477105 RepID=UPI00094FD900|nr:hypothetical protein [Labilibacter marinus]
MHKVILWVEFEDLVSVGEISEKADIKLTIEGDSKKIEIVSQLDLKSGIEFEYDEYGEYCVSLESEFVNYKENFVFDKQTEEVEILVK